jgi:hypothetical protein
MLLYGREGRQCNIAVFRQEGVPVARCAAALASLVELFLLPMRLHGSGLTVKRSADAIIA